MDISVQYGRVEGINQHTGREIYGKVSERPGIRDRVSLQWFSKQTENVGKKYDVLGFCAESVSDWTVKSGTLRDLGNMIGCSADSVRHACNTKSLILGHFIYRKGQRPDEDEIDEMLDRYGL